MPLLEWSERLSIGIAMVDADHQRLVAMLNELYDAVSAGQGKEALGKVLDGLIDYTKTHFAREEVEMAKTRYPGAVEHARQHGDLTQRVVGLQAQYRAGHRAVLSIEVLAFLRDWWLQHTQGTDREMGRFLQQQRSMHAS